MSWNDFCEVMGWKEEDRRFLNKVFEGGKDGSI